MPLSPSGVYTLPSGYLAVTGQDILPSQHNPPLEDIGSVLSEAFYRTGVAPMLANLNMNTFKMIGVGNGTAATDGVNKGQLDGAILTPSNGTVIFDTNNVMIQCGSSVVTTNASGDGTVTFPTSFSGAPVSVVATSGDFTAAECSISLANPMSSNGFSFSTTPSFISGNMRVNWFAMGAKT